MYFHFISVLFILLVVKVMSHDCNKKVFYVKQSVLLIKSFSIFSRIENLITNRFVR